MDRNIELNTERAMKNTLFLSTVFTPFGKLLVGTNNDAVCMIRFATRNGDQPFLDDFLKETGFKVVESSRALNKKVATEISEFFNGKRTVFSFKIKLYGSKMQLKIWEEIHNLKIGDRLELEELAQQIRYYNIHTLREACIANPVCLAVPTHRVDGYTVYEGGANRKHLLNRFEEFFMKSLKLKIAA